MGWLYMVSVKRELEVSGKGRKPYRDHAGMVEIERLAQLACAVRLAGGPSAVAAKAGLDPSNTSRFLHSARGLSSASVRRLETALGRPNGQADDNSVVVIRSDSVGDDLALGLAWYLPEGGEVARAAWSGLRKDSFKKLIRGVIGRFVPEVYALRDQQGTRLILILAAGLVLPRDYFDPEAGLGLRWFDANRQNAVLDLGAEPQNWLDGSVTPEQFDSSWPSTEFAKTAKDVIALIEHMGISYEEAIRRIVDNQ